MTTFITEQSFKDVMDSLAASTPAPGGGTAAALAGVMAASLVQMVVNLTLGRKKYQQVQETMQELLVRASELRGQLSELATEDARAYEEVMQAYKFPKATPEEVSTRNQAIERALHGAATVPLRTAQAAMQVLDLTAQVAEAGNNNALTDAGVASLLAHAAIQAALYNVRVNITMLNPRPTWAEEMENTVNALETRAIEVSSMIATTVTGQIT
ncbi:MAG: glutamate formiminotransferase / formiminotetrahydrofolate cyclodeaminase [Bacillota bacterium]|nr:MAG: glutamate formiminotransferase / formiminotetrahydrofolate cyclodeaminase [Bacillota bacterium]